MMANTRLTARWLKSSGDWMRLVARRTRRLRSYHGRRTQRWRLERQRPSRVADRVWAMKRSTRPIVIRVRKSTTLRQPTTRLPNRGDGGPETGRHRSTRLRARVLDKVTIIWKKTLIILRIKYLFSSKTVWQVTSDFTNSFRYKSTYPMDRFNYEFYICGRTGPNRISPLATWPEATGCEKRYRTDRGWQLSNGVPIVGKDCKFERLILALMSSTQLGNS